MMVTRQAPAVEILIVVAIELIYLRIVAVLELVSNRMYL